MIPPSSSPPPNLIHIFWHKSMLMHNASISIFDTNIDLVSTRSIAYQAGSIASGQLNPEKQVHQDPASHPAYRDNHNEPKENSIPSHAKGNSPFPGKYAAIVIDNERDIKYYGASTSFEVHELSDVSVNQATGAQVILAKGEQGPRSYINAIHFGWHIFYRDEHDNLPHFFTYWTTDGYQQSRCLNMLCPGYVQISNGTTPGIIIPKGEIELSVSRDRSTGNWLLRFVDNNNELLGYWPKELFNNMADSSQVQVHGVVNSPKDVPSPPMGNGNLPTTFFSAAAKFRRIRLMNGNGDFFPPSSEKVTTFVDLSYDFYALDHLRDHGGTWGYGFDYGGPGGWYVN
ncbi:hypothetical protein COCNU_05G006100 [Cocos nucifera]|uniref:Neprosin PEP catalytic domain-containing protein n=1 Tax=Cocos nucifera TaxID=13894 RepID=A0A8K0I9G8_COCNU|nr:hypothetical protein COCNU_05G006100 [Cocos nucifera]